MFKSILEGSSPHAAPAAAASLPNTFPPSTSASSVSAPVNANVTRPDQPQRHSMQTRSKSGVLKSNKQFTLLSSVSPLPTSHLKALQDPNWTPAMTVEIDAFDKAKTWDLVPRPSNANVITCLWLYKHKLDAEGKPKRHRARLVANGKSQEEGIDYTDTFAPVVKPATIRAVLDVSLARDWPIH